MEKKKSIRKTAGKKRNLVFYLVLVVFVLSIISVSFSFFKLRNLTPVDVFEVDVVFEIDDFYGIDLDTSELNFGVVPLGGSISRKITIENKRPYPINVRIFKTIDIEEFIHFERIFTLDPWEKKRISVSLIVPSEAEKGIYRGKLFFEFWRG